MSEMLREVSAHEALVAAVRQVEWDVVTQQAQRAAEKILNLLVANGRIHNYEIVAIIERECATKRQEAVAKAQAGEGGTMKFGYKCICGWRLSRGKLTRKQYAELKQWHADGMVKDGKRVTPPCEFLQKELARSKQALAKGRGVK